MNAAIVAMNSTREAASLFVGSEPRLNFSVERSPQGIGKHAARSAHLCLIVGSKRQISETEIGRRAATMIIEIVSVRSSRLVPAVFAIADSRNSATSPPSSTPGHLCNCLALTT
ncbi:MAG: hypothetical protein QOJ72_2941 [Nocardioidaceae bacterium]|nr:hypothetical protein [Nocardioidaceae bacterium]